MTKYLVLAGLLLATTACGDTWGERAVTGGGIGAGSGGGSGAPPPNNDPPGGPVIGALTPIGILPGALVGTAVGAGVGAATTPRR
jgi:osmotically inducible lipoprotein OsmB